METLKLIANVPEVISLAFAQGKVVTGLYGDQVLFSLEDGRRFYTSPYVAEKIYAAGIGARTPFTICKREVSHGNRRTVEFEITTHNAARVTPTTSDAMVNALKASISAAGATVQATPATPQQPAREPLSSLESTARKANQANPTSNIHSDAPAWVNAAETLGFDAETVAMFEAHKRAIDVAIGAEAYAKDHGLAIRYTADDIRQIAATLYIQKAKGGAR